MTEISIPGQKDTAAVGERPATELGVSVTVKDAVRVGAMRSSETPVTVSAADDDLVELDLEGGAVLWLRGDEVSEQLRPVTTRGIAVDGVVALDTSLPIDDRRGLGSWTIRALRVLGIDLAGQSAKAVAERLEQRAVAKPNLYRWDGKESFVPLAETTAGDQPWLVFIHGTASSTRGSFGDLAAAQPTIWQKLSSAYQGRILALEHHSLTKSPIANARDLVAALPVGAELHLVSHSRGGLVGELVGRGRLTDENGRSRAPFDAVELDLFTEDYADQRAELEALANVLIQQQPKVTRFIRVACPARGTSLMAGRLDRWLNLVFNVMSLPLGGRLNPVTSGLLGGLKELVQAVVKERSDPDTLPGLAAMSPEFSPLLTVLNRLETRQDDGLFVIAGDVEPTALLQRLAIWFTDLYFGQDHDLVVDTSSMDGGAIRTTAPVVFMDQGATVTHFNYFANARSAHALSTALIDAEKARSIGEELSRAAAEGMPRLATRSAGQAPVVFVLPGISGTHLKIGKRRIWIDMLQLALGGVQKLALDRPRVEADEPVGRYYGELARFLDTSHDVKPWPYDWRRSILETAEQFARDLGMALDTTDHAVRIVAHSMGGLVARTAFALDKPLWERFAERAGGRLVMLGTPNGGSFSIPMLLTGRNQLMQYLALLDLRANAADQLQVVAGWPGAVQMLPKVNGDLGLTAGADLFTRKGWETLAEADAGKRWTAPSADILGEARRFRDLFDKASIDPDRMVYIAGQADTYEALEVDPEAGQRDRLRFRITTEGDGQVLWRTGIPEGMPAWYTNAAHGDLARHAPAFPAILDLLQQGTTDKLPRQKPVVARSRYAPRSIAKEPVHRVPAEDELLAAALGGAPWVRPRLERKVVVRVVHGHLKHATFPLMVGHYENDSLNGSELTLDREQGGRISRRRDRGLHPGQIGTFDVHLDSDQQPPGSVIVGLGQVSDLSTGSLRQTVRRGLLALASGMDERDEHAHKGREAAAVAPRGVSFVLIGSGAGVVAIGDSVITILRAVREANRELGEKGFVELELIELDEQRAINAWHTIERRLARAELQNSFTLDGPVRRRGSAWRRIGPDDDPTWWTPITIRDAATVERARGEASRAAPPDEGALHYVVLSGRARVEANLVGTQRDVIDLYLQRIAKSQVEQGSASAARTLFELIWPNSLKEHSLEDRNIRLILDETAAALPWEMMDDRRPWLTTADSGGAGARLGPPAVRFGVIRQLVSTQIREATKNVGPRRRALVVGDPIGAGATFAELPGAQEEARQVQAVLERHGYEVVALIGEKAMPEAVISELLTDAWDIVHIAAHGVFQHPFGKEPDAKPRTGIVLGGQPRPMILDSTVLNQMPVTPELFFVNCCSLGGINPTEETEHLWAARPALASSIAVQLIRMGVRAVVAAGWEVGDRPAQQFASTFYETLLAGENFGRAVQDARGEIFAQRPTDSTWGAYQCYGHQDFRLPDHTEPARHPAGLLVLAAPGEAISQIELICALGKVGGERDTAADFAALARLEEVIAQNGWLDQAELRAKLAEAYADLDQIDKAIEHYKAAARAEQAWLPVRAIEQQLNLAARRAAQAADPKKKAKAAEVIEQSIDRLRSLTEACGKTLERLSLVGSAYKRLARISTGEMRTEALASMEEAYRVAREWGQTHNAPELYYPWSQELGGKVLLSLRRNETAELDCEGLRSSLRPAVSDDFWLRILPADLRLLELVSDGDLPEPEQDDIIATYQKAWKDAGSNRELRSVLDQVGFLHSMLGDLRPEKDGLLDALQTLRQRLEAMSRQ